MKVRALFFASYRDLAGTAEIAVPLPATCTVAELIGRLRAPDGPVPRLPARPAVAINLRFSRLDAALSDGDEVAFIPPVAGG